MNFTFTLAETIRFGRGVSLEAGRLLRERGAAKALLVYDKGVARAGLVAPVREAIAGCGVAVADFDEVQPNPLDTTIEKGARVARDNGVDAVVALGGGSSIDCAKGVNILLANGGTIGQYAGLNKVGKKGRLLVAIPTTAGTSSDITSVCVVTDAAQGRRYVVLGRFVGADCTLVDPALTDALPAKVTAVSGIDALTHAIESYTSRRASPLTEPLSLRAAALLYPNLSRAVKDPGDREARDNMMAGCVLVGCAFSNAGLGLAHSISNALSTQCDVPHGIACGAPLPHVIAFNEPAAGEKHAALAAAACPGSGKSLSELVLELEREIGVPTLSQCGVTPDKVDALTAEIMEDNFANNPRQGITAEDIRALLEQSM